MEITNDLVKKLQFKLEKWILHRRIVDNFGNMINLVLFLKVI